MIFKDHKIKSCFVLGSTSEVAKAICEELAKNDCTKFYLLARNSEQNQRFSKYLRSKYDVEIIEGKFDLLKDSFDYLNKIDFDKYDLYLFTAGFLGNNKLAENNTFEAMNICKVNYSNLIPLISIVYKNIENTKKIKRLWVFSSVAADIGRPSNYHYGAAKAGFTTFCEGLFYRSYKKPILVRIIKAGFIATKMSKGKAPKFLSVHPSKLAKNLLRNPNRRGIEYKPWWWNFFMKVIKKMPPFIISKL